MADLRSISSAAQAAATQATETQPTRTGKSRIKPRQLSPLIRRLIVEQFSVRQSTEDVAEEMRLPVRTVNDVILHAVLRKAA